MKILRSIPLCALASAVLCIAATAQPAAPAVRILAPIDANQLVTLRGNVNPHANAANDRGAVSASFPLPDLTLVLSRSAAQQAAFDAFVASQYDPGSANFHQWLTPQQIGAQFGPAQADIATITNWLAGQGFTVKSVSPDGMTIKFAGTAGTVQTAFHTSIHMLSVHGVAHYANMTDPQIPAALAPVVVGVKALHNFLPKPLHKMGSLVQFNREAGKWQRIAASASTAGQLPLKAGLSVSATQAFAGKSALPTPSLNPHPLFGINGSYEGSNYLEEDVTPNDFATIYNVTPAWNNGITGTGETIAIAGTSKIDLTDVSTYRAAFDLPAGLTPNEIDTGMGPAATICTSTSASAICGIGDLEENSLDVELSGAVATAAQIDLVVTGQNSSGTIDTVYDSASYVVSHETAKILSVSYGECELGQGTAENVAYYDLWQSAAAEGISVFVASGDSGAPSCDDDLDEQYGNPYLAQYGLSVSGMASTPFNTAVGGTDFSWCQPYVTASGQNLEYSGCATSSTSQGSSAYWNTSNASNGASAANYVPEIPWNDTCENPINARYLETFLDYGFGVTGLSTPEQTCNYIYNNWYDLDEYYYEETEGGEFGVETYVDTVGGSGGVSSCVVNSTNPDSPTGALGLCSTGSTSTGATTNPDSGSAQASIPLVNDGWPAPSWQSSSGVPGTSSLTNRAIPDVSFFAGNGALDSATLICLSAAGACTYSSSTENTAQEVGGTSVASPEMAGVMALIDQKAGAPQGLANPELYKLASQQTYSECSAESVKNSSSCYFQDIDNGPTASSGPSYTTAQTIAMPCDLTGTPEGGDDNEEFDGLASPNCYAMTSGDTIGTLGTSSTTAAYNSTTGFDMATGLGSLNVANVVDNWVSDAGTKPATLGVTLNPTGSLSASTALTLTVTVSGSSGTPTGSIAVAGGGYSGSGTLANGQAQIGISAGSLAVGNDTLTVTYSGDGTYASTSTTESVTVTAAAPLVTVSAPASDNVANAVQVVVTVTGLAGVPTGTVNLSGGGYSSAAVTLSSGGTATFTIPANTLAGGNDTLTADYSGNSTYAGGTGTAVIDIVTTTALASTVKVNPASTSIDSAQALTVNVAVSGAGATPTGTLVLTAGTYTSTTTALTGGGASFSVPGGSLTASGPITAVYSGDAVYASGTGSATETVTPSTYALSASTPTAVSPGATATSTVTGTNSTTDYSGTVTLSSCSLTSSSVTDPNSPPSCTVSGTITYTGGTASGSGTVTVSTTAASTVDLVRPRVGKGWLGGGAVLAFLVFLGIPARSKSWRAMLGMVVLLVTMGSLVACGGGGSANSGGTTVEGTSAGTYTFTVTGTGNDVANTKETTTFTVTVN